MNVAELIEYLKTLDPMAEVGTSGHYGEIHTMDKCDFYIRTLSLRKERGRLVEVKPTVMLIVTTPDIGPEPN